MNMTALIARAYVEVQRTTGVKPDVRSRINRMLGRPVEPDFAALKAFRPGDGMVMVDAGANRGETIASTRMFLPSAPIVAFEPNPVLCTMIRSKMASDVAFTLNEVGLGDTPGTFELHVPFYKGVPFDGLASFRREEAANWLNGERLAGFDQKHHAVRAYTCEVACLDRFDLKPAFIKIDVQGLEPAVIRGGLATIKTHLPAILMENNQPETDAAALFDLGYKNYAFADGRFTANAFGSLNTFYLHDRTRDRFAAAMFSGAA